MSIASKNKERQNKLRHYSSVLMSYKSRVDRGDLDIDNYDFSIFDDKEEDSRDFIRRCIKTKIKPVGFDI